MIIEDRPRPRFRWIVVALIVQLLPVALVAHVAPQSRFRSTSVFNVNKTTEVYQFRFTGLGPTVNDASLTLVGIRYGLSRERHLASLRVEFSDGRAPHRHMLHFTPGRTRSEHHRLLTLQLSGWDEYTLNVSVTFEDHIDALVLDWSQDQPSWWYSREFVHSLTGTCWLFLLLLARYRAWRGEQVGVMVGVVMHIVAMSVYHSQRELWFAEVTSLYLQAWTLYRLAVLASALGAGVTWLGFLTVFGNVVVVFFGAPVAGVIAHSLLLCLVGSLAFALRAESEDSFHSSVLVTCFLLSAGSCCLSDVGWLRGVPALTLEVGVIGTQTVVIALLVFLHQRVVDRMTSIIEMSPSLLQHDVVFPPS